MAENLLENGERPTEEQIRSLVDQLRGGASWDAATLALNNIGPAVKSISNWRRFLRDQIRNKLIKKEKLIRRAVQIGLSPLERDLIEYAMTTVDAEGDDEGGSVRAKRDRSCSPICSLEPKRQGTYYPLLSELSFPSRFVNT